MADVATLEELLDTTILALDGTAYGGTWRACASPGMLSATRQKPAHLLFDAYVADGETERVWTGGECAGDQRLERIVVEFYYRERAQHEREDWRLAATAAEEVTRALIAAGGPWNTLGPPTRERVLDEAAGAPMRWYLVRIEIQAPNLWHWTAA